ncbi:MAG: helix-turn-helix transcriptional regulator [bacterium]|nr:helix-turn-helix transcriptional regulator [bacterium]
MQEENENNLAKRLKAIREALGLNQGQLAERVKVSAPTLSELEKGRFTPKFHVVVNLVVEFNVNPFYLILGQGEMFGDKPELPSDILEHLIINKEEFLKLIDYMKRSQFVQYSIMSGFQALMRKDGDTVKRQLDEFEKGKE